jgi:HPt (histidine-containing phosphotransfer) domain-containing protein
VEKRKIKAPEDLRDLAIAYVETRKHDMAALKDALTRKDFEFIQRHSHKTKGTAASYGFIELGDIAKSLEKAAIAKTPAETESLLNAMGDYLASVEILP